MTPDATVYLNANIKELASNKADEMISNEMYSRMGCDDDSRWEKAYIGALGEYAFAELLDENGIPYAFGEYDPSTNSDNGDIWVGDCCIDIKVAKSELEGIWISG